MKTKEQLNVELMREAAKLGLMLKGVHDAANLFPFPTEEDFNGLCNDLQAKGQITPIMLSRNAELIDGRSRLLACARLGIEPKTAVLNNGLDPYQYAVSANLARRHLTTGQKADIGVSLEEVFAEQAKERQREAGMETRSNQYQKKESAACPKFGTSCNPEGKAIKQAAKAVGVSHGAIDQMKTVREYTPEAAEEVRAGTRTLNDAYKPAALKKKQAKAQQGAEKKARKREEGQTIKVHGLSTEVDIVKPEKSTFNRTNDNVSWSWWTWNPVTGCNHGCRFCYAREIANTMHRRSKDLYPLNFDPAFYPHRLDAPKNSVVPKSDDPRSSRVFVCSMADLFGKWVPDHWIASVFNACLENPQWTYLFLTKWPNRYAQLPLIDGAWYGASVIQQADVKRVSKSMQAFADQNVTRWISLEPMLEPIQFDDIGWCDLMVIGAQTETKQPNGPVAAFSPKFEWVASVVDQCRQQDVPVYLKPNLGRDEPGMDLPQMMPRLR